MGNLGAPGVPQLVWSASGGNYGLSQYTGGDATSLIVQTPYSISGGFASGATTIFFNASLVLTPSETNQAVGTVATTPDGSILSQTLGPASFDIYSGPSGSGSVLLAGTFNSASITGVSGMTTGSVMSSDVIYTSGSILEAAEAGSTFTQMTGPFSWSLLNASSVFQKDASSVLAPFTATATGQFIATSQVSVPEPATTVLLASIAPIAFFFLRRRFRR
jgi:hypothetical protein